MAAERSSPGTIYSPLPQSMSDVDSTCDEEEEEELNSVALGNEGVNHPLKTTHIHGAKSVTEGKNGRGRANRGLYQPLGGSDLTLNGIPSQIRLKSKNDCLHESDMDSSQPPLILPNIPDKLVMSTARKTCFFFSILLCFLVVIGFLFVLPCDLPACVPAHEKNSTSATSESSLASMPTSTIRSMGGSWERVLPGIELKGRAHLITSSSGPGLNMVFLVRGQLAGLSSASALSPPSAMSLLSSSFLSESSKCSFAPAPGSSNGSSLNGIDQSTLATYCNTELEVTLNNTSSQQGWMTSPYLGDEVLSQIPEVNLSASHYRSKRILDNPPNISPSEVTELMDPGVEHREVMKSAQMKVDGEISNGGLYKSVEKTYQDGHDRDHKEISTEKKSKEKRSAKSVEKNKVEDNGSIFLSALVGGDGGLVSLSGATGQPLWAVSLHSPPEELDCALLDTDNDGIPDCLAFAGRSGLLAAVNPTSGSVIWYLHDHRSQERPIALQFPVSIPDIDGDGTKDLAIACTLPSPSPQTINQSSNKASSTSPNSSSYTPPQVTNPKGSSSKSSSSSKKDLLYSSSTYSAESSSYQSVRPLPSPSSSPDTVSLAVASGRSGKIISHPFTPTGCVTVSSITLNMKTLDLFYRCVTEEGDEISKSLSVDDLIGERRENISSSSAPPINTPTPALERESDGSESFIEQESILSMPLTASSVENVSPSFSSSSTSHFERHSTSSSAWVSDHRLLVENHGHCHTILLSPFSANSSFQTPPCSVSVRLTDSRNSTLWAHEGVLAHAMDPVPLLFRQPSRGLWPEDSPSASQSSVGVSEHPVSGFVLKFWQWSMPKVESGPMGREDKSRDPTSDKSPGGPNSLFRTRLKRRISPDLILPPLAAAASSSSSSPSSIQNHSSQAKRQSPIGNLPRHGGLFPSGSGKKKLKGTSYKGMLPPIVNQLKERVVLITFNDTGLHVINASQSDVTQLCERIRLSGGSGKKRGKGGRLKDKVNQDNVPLDQKLRCQPELAFQEQSLLVADLDKDGYQELVSYLTTYVDIRKDDSDSRRRTNSPKWFLESRVKVVLLEAELPKLYEAVATPGS